MANKAKQVLQRFTVLVFSACLYLFISISYVKSTAVPQSVANG